MNSGEVSLYSPPGLAVETSLDPEEEHFREFCRASVARLLSDRGFQRALRALTALEREQIDPGEALASLVDMIPLLAALAVTKQPQRHTGQTTWKAIAGLPGRLRNMAEQVDQLTKSPFFGAITGDTPINAFIRSRVASLLAELQFSAAWVEGRARWLRALTRQASGRKPRGHRPEMLYLSRLIRLGTGRFCDRQAADLLNAADLALNPGDTRSGERFDVQTLRDLRSRQKRKTART